MKRRIIIPVFGAMTAFTLWGQVPFANQDKLFYEGKELFAEKNFNGTIDKMTRYKESATNTDLIQEAEMYVAVSEFEKNNSRSTELLENYIKKYTSGRHNLTARFLLASSRFYNKQYNDAIDLFEQINPDMLSAYDQEDYYLRLGISLLKEEKLDEANQVFEAVGSVSKRHKQKAQYYTSYIAYLQHNYKKAIPVLKKLENDPEFRASAPCLIAQIYYAERKYEEVIQKGEPLLRNNQTERENRAELTRIVGESYFYTGNSQKAFSLLSTYIEEEAHPIRDGRYVLGVLLYEQNNYTQALEQLKQVTGANDDMTQSAYLYEGQIYLKQNNKKAARLAFESAMKSGSDKEIRETAMYNYAMLIHETSFSVFDESVTIYEKFINEFPRSRYADKINDCLVEVYMTTKNYTAALTSIQKIKQPSNKVLAAKQRILFQLGTMAVANADFKGSINYFNETLKLGDLDRETKAEALFWRGESLYRSTLYYQAIKDFQLYLSITTRKSKPIYALGLYSLGYSYFKIQDFANAKKWFNQFINVDNSINSNMLADALNRLGDCYFDGRDFANAEIYYNRAAEVQPDAADYAMYQKGFVQGLKKDYQGKIATMDRLIREMPNSGYVDDAMFEKGRTYMFQEQYAQAEITYKDLMAKYPQGEPSRKASVQLGLLYFNTEQLPKAIDAYKHVINTYPGSEEAATAAQDLKSVYMEMNDIQSYAQYIRSIDTNVKFEVSEQDSLTYLSAEKIFMRGDLKSAERSLNNYLQNFPDGAFMANANFYLGSLYFNEKEYSRASQAFDRVLTVPQSKFAEDALARNSEIAYLSNDFNQALPLFKQLEASASKPENRKAAQLGVLRCAFQLGKTNDASVMAAAMLKEPNLSPEIRQEALYVFVKTNPLNKVTPQLTELSKDTRNVFGAEATYLLAKSYFDAEENKKAEETILAFMDMGTPHQYWMARCFLLLSDLYIKTGKPLDAKQYLLSLQTNYKANDEIASEIEKRLNTIQ